MVNRGEEKVRVHMNVVPRGGEALRDDPNNGCGGDYVSRRQSRPSRLCADFVLLILTSPL